MIEFLKAQPEQYHAQIMDLLGREVLQMSIMMHLDFADQPLRLSNRNIPFQDLQLGNEWQAGAGMLVGLPEIAGGDDQLAPFREFRLGMPLDWIDEENWRAEVVQMVGDVRSFRGRDAGLYGQIFDAETSVPVGHPFVLDTGVMDKMSVSFGRAGAIISLTVEGFLSRKGAPVYGMQTYFDQKRRHPTDEGLQFVTESKRLITLTNW